MSLPIRQLPSAEYTFPDGTKTTIRGLSRAEAIQLQGLSGNLKKLEILCIKAATGVTEEEAEAWYAATPNEEVSGLVDAIAALSGLDPDQGKDDAEGSHSAKLTELITYLQKISENLSLKSESSQAPR